MKTSLILVHGDNITDRELGRTWKTVRQQGMKVQEIWQPVEGLSPTGAANEALRMATGDVVVMCIDAARMLSPGVLRGIAAAFEKYEYPFVQVAARHLGPAGQTYSISEGYGREAEDRLLRTVPWHKDGYRLFDVSVPVQSPGGPLVEATCWAARREAVQSLGGYDERFESPGGGMCALELFERYQAKLTGVLLAGEATFHQFHGGVSTNVFRADHPKPAQMAEYERVMGRMYAYSPAKPEILEF